MNLKKNILAFAAALGLIGTGSASAANVTYIAGATSFRNIANVQIAAYATNNGGQLLAIDSSSITSAANILVSFTNAGGLNYIVAHWTGAEAGIQSAAGPANGATNAATITFFPTNTVGWTNAPASASLATVAHTTDITFSENFQSTSIFNGRINGVPYSSLSGWDGADGIVAISVYSFVASKGFPSTASLTAQAFNQIAAGGNIPLTLITGNAADFTNSVWLIGRNVDSGARLNILAETGYGVRTPVTTYAVATNYTGGGSGLATLKGTTTTNSLLLYPVETIDGISSVSAGNSGYGSGSTVVAVLTNAYAPGAGLQIGSATSAPVGTNTAAISYTAAPRAGSNFLIGFSAVPDITAKTNAGVVPVAYNGVSFSTNAVAQGQYTLWGYEHIYVSPNATTTDTNVAQALGSTILNLPTASLNPAVNIADMQAGRNGDGGIVYSNY